MRNWKQVVPCLMDELQRAFPDWSFSIQPIGRKSIALEVIDNDATKEHPIVTDAAVASLAAILEKYRPHPEVYSPVAVTGTDDPAFRRWMATGRSSTRLVLLRRPF